MPAALVITQQRAAAAATILSILDGTASVARGTASFAAAADGDIVNTGDRVQTAERSHAMVTFFDGSTLEIEPATIVRIPQGAVAGTTYKITASGGGLTQTADVVIAYSPTLTLLNTFPPRANTPVAYSGGGWPPNISYSIVFDGGRSAIGGGVTTAAGTIAGSFTVPLNTTPGAHTVTATAGLYSANASLTTQ